jgi:hypothetical protein
MNEDETDRSRRQLLSANSRPLDIRHQSPLMARIKARTQRKTREEQLRLAGVENELGRAIRDKLAIRREIEIAAWHLDDVNTEIEIERRERAAILARLERDAQDYADYEGQRMQRNLLADHFLGEAVANAEADRLEAEQRRDRLRTPAATAPEKNSGKIKIERVQRVYEERDEMILAVLRGREEVDLEEEQRRTIERIRLGAEDAVLRVLEGTI